MSPATIMPSTAPDAVSRAWPASLHRDRQAAFEAARRHTRRVHTLRVLLPLAGCAALGILALASRLPAPEGLDIAAQASIARSAAVMENPRVTGFDRAGRHYRVSAERAVQNFARPQEVRLEGVVVEVAGQGGATIGAGRGDYDGKAGRLRLSEHVAIAWADGDARRLEGAEIDLRAGTLVSGREVFALWRDGGAAPARSRLGAEAD